MSGDRKEKLSGVGSRSHRQSLDVLESRELVSSRLNFFESLSEKAKQASTSSKKITERTTPLPTSDSTGSMNKYFSDCKEATDGPGKLAGRIGMQEGATRTTISRKDFYSLVETHTVALASLMSRDISEEESVLKELAVTVEQALSNQKLLPEESTDNKPFGEIQSPARKKSSLATSSQHEEKKVETITVTREDLEAIEQGLVNKMKVLIAGNQFKEKIQPRRADVETTAPPQRRKSETEVASDAAPKEKRGPRREVETEKKVTRRKNGGAQEEKETNGKPAVTFSTGASQPEDEEQAAPSSPVEGKLESPEDPRVAAATAPLIEERGRNFDSLRAAVVGGENDNAATSKRPTPGRLDLSKFHSKPSTEPTINKTGQKFRFPSAAGGEASPPARRKTKTPRSKHPSDATIESAHNNNISLRDFLNKVPLSHDARRKLVIIKQNLQNSITQVDDLLVQPSLPKATKQKLKLLKTELQENIATANTRLAGPTVFVNRHYISGSTQPLQSPCKKPEGDEKSSVTDKNGIPANYSSDTTEILESALEGRSEAQQREAVTSHFINFLINTDFTDPNSKVTIHSHDLNLILTSVLTAKLLGQVPTDRLVIEFAPKEGQVITADNKILLEHFDITQSADGSYTPGNAKKSYDSTKKKPHDHKTNQFIDKYKKLKIMAATNDTHRDVLDARACVNKSKPKHLLKNKDAAPKAASMASMAAAAAAAATGRPRTIVPELPLPPGIKTR